MNKTVCTASLRFLYVYFQVKYKGPPIRRIACGGEFSMISDINGNLYSFGCPEYGQLGVFVLCHCSLSSGYDNGQPDMPAIMISA